MSNTAGFFALVAIVGLLAAAAYNIWIGRTVHFDAGRSTLTDPISAVDDLLARLAERLTPGGYKVIESGRGYAGLEWRGHRPRWTIAVAILLFPFGLLALLVHDTHRITVITTEMANGIHAVQVTGHVTPWARDVALGELRA